MIDFGYKRNEANLCQRKNVCKIRHETNAVRNVWNWWREQTVEIYLYSVMQHFLYARPYATVYFCMIRAVLQELATGIAVAP